MDPKEKAGWSNSTKGIVAFFSTILGIPALIGFIALSEMSRDVYPSHLRIHMEHGKWRSLTFGGHGIDAPPEPGPTVYPKDGDTVVSEPIYYGPHYFEVLFADGKTAYFVYFLTDAGWMGDVDIDVTHALGSDSLYANCVSRRRPAIFGQTYQDFKGKARFSEATATEPLVLESV